MAKSGRQLFRRTARGSYRFSLIPLFLLMSLVFVAVIARYVFDRPIIGEFEFSALLMVCLLFFGIGYVTSQRGNVTLEMVVIKLPPRTRVLLDRAICLVLAIFLAIVFWQSLLRAIYSYQSWEVASGLSTPHFIGRSIVAWGWLLCSLAMFDLFLQSFRHGKNGRE